MTNPEARRNDQKPGVFIDYSCFVISLVFQKRDYRCRLEFFSAIKKLELD
jgi:hypothetical protein